MPFKKGFKYFDFLFTAYIFAYFLVWTFPTKVWTFPTKVWTFPTKKCPQPYCHKGFQRRKRLQKVTKGINNPYIPFFFKKTGFFKKKQKIKNRIKPFLDSTFRQVRTCLRVSSKLLRKKSCQYERSDRVNPEQRLSSMLFFVSTTLTFRQLNVFEGREKKKSSGKRKNREASTTGGCMLKTPKPI
ncbi:hypothetical protein [Bifidobacterium adolescentis]|uniref:hypothetical protein n=1 Tax=Bifidobacterium adolescentis TaxID=1680 RepID=UPI0034A3683A